MFIIQAQYFDLERTFYSGQALRWKRLDEYRYIIFDDEDAVLISQNKDRIIIEDTEANFFSRWYQYLSFDIPYDKVYYSLTSMKDEQLNKIILKCTNVHLVRKSIFELLVTCILSYKSERKTRMVLDDIAEACGKKSKKTIRGIGKFTWYIFPTPEELVSNVILVHSIDDKRKKLLVNIAEKIIEGRIDLDELTIATNKFNVNDILCDYLPITIIKKVCLGLGIFDAFPVTKSVKETLVKKELDINVFRSNVYRGLLFYMFERIRQYPLAKTDYGVLYEYSRPNKKRRARKRRKDTII